jgi:IS30 family transposase
MKRYTHLKREERTLLAHFYEAGHSLTQIARDLGRSKSTISAEIARNRNKSGAYNPMTATRRYQVRLKRLSLLDQDLTLQHYVRDRLHEGHSPELIAYRLKRYPEAGIRYINHNAIYDWLYKPQQKKERLYKLLPQGKGRRGWRKRVHRGGIQHRISLDNRPEYIKDRLESGHWEADLISFKGNTRHMLVLHERKTRYTATLKLNNKTADHTLQQLLSFFKSWPHRFRRSVTFDNGLEFARHYKLKESLGIKTYFCDVYASWHKGGIENMNGRLRRDLPRKTDVDHITDADLEHIMLNHNLTPRKVLSGKTPIEALAFELGPAIIFSFSRSVLLKP